jgi:hypothetical protein
MREKWRLIPPEALWEQGARFIEIFFLYPFFHLYQNLAPMPLA